MALLHPVALAWLGLMVPILLLYLLRLKRREVTISSVLFWSSAVDDMQANAPFQRLRRNLLLYLQLAVVVALAVALARPFQRTTALGGSTVVAVLDGSASMAAPLGGGTRFQSARARVAEMIGDLERGDELMLLLATDRVEVLHPLSADRRALRRALGSAAAGDRPTDLRDALLLATSAVRGRPEARVYLFTDGAVPPLTDLSADVAGVELVTIGEPADNVGITALDARRSLSERSRTQVLLTLEASGPSPAPREVEVEFRSGHRLLDLRQLSVTPGKPLATILSDLPIDSGLLEVRLTTADALAADNLAYVSLGSARQSELLLVGKPDLFLDKALAIDHRVRPVKYDLAGFQTAAGDGTLPPGAVAVFCGQAPAGEVPLPALYLNATGEGCPAEATGTVADPRVIDWAPDHPVTRYVDFEHLAVATARRCRPKPWARTVVEADSTPLMVAGERDGRRRVYLGFELVDSDLPLRAGFPILIANIVGWLTSGADSVATPTVRSGEPVALRLATTAATARVTRPDGTRVQVPLDGDRARYGETDRVGLYQVAAGEAGTSFAVSLLSPVESDLTPRAELRVGGVRVVGPSRDTQRVRERWRPLAWLAVVLLMLEWWWYHRRG